MLEGYAAATAATLITEEEMRRLAELQVELATARARGDGKRVLAANEEFHFLVYKAACVPVLVDVISTLWLHSAPTLNLFFRSGKRPRDYIEKQNREQPRPDREPAAPRCRRARATPSRRRSSRAAGCSTA